MYSVERNKQLFFISLILTKNQVFSLFKPQVIVECMEAVMEIELQKVKVYGFHGLHAGEEIIGGEFEVNLTASYVPADITIKKIQETLDYTELLKIVKRRMQQPAPLIETLATEIGSEIIAKFSIVTEVAISIYKLHPPIENFEGLVGVTYKLKR